MREENNEVVEEKEINESSEVKDEKKKSKAGIIVPLLAAVLAFALVYGGITLVQYLTADNNSNGVENGNKDEEVDVEDSNETDESNDEVDTGATGTTAPEIPITITDTMKNELNNIASIRDRYCFTEKLFYSMNGLLKDLPVESKKFIVIDYYVINNPGVTTISEACYKEIAAKYSFTESFDTIFAGVEKSGNDYVIPPMGCIGPEVVSHNATYEDTGNTITVIDNVTITNQETKEARNIKVIYTFIYSGEGNNITFKLHQVNHEVK